MNAEHAVVRILLDTPAVMALVDGRIYLDQAPQTDPYPLIIIEEQDNEPTDTKSGVSVLDFDTIRVYPYAEDKDTLRLLAQACRTALDGKTPGVYNGYTIQDVRFLGQTSFDDLITNRKVYAKDQEYRIAVVV